MAGGTSAAMELKVLISIMQSGTALQTMLTQVGQLSQALTKLQAQQAQPGAGGGTVPPVPPIAPQLNEGSDAAKRAALSMEGLEKSIHKVIRAAQFLAGGFLALQSVRFLRSLADAAAQNQVLGTVLHVVALNAGKTAEEIDKVDRAVQRLGITAAASRRSLTQFLQARLDLTFAPKLARAAQDLAVIAGTNSSETFRRMIVNIQQLDTLGLRMMGIVVDRAAAEKKYKEEIGATTRELNKREQQTALMLGLLEKAKLLEGTYSSAMNDAAKQLTSLERLTDTYRAALGDSLLPAYSAIISEVVTMFEKLVILAQEFSSNRERAQQLADTVQVLASWFSNLAIFLMEHLSVIVKIIQYYLVFKGVLMALKGAEMYLMWLIKVADWVNKIRIAFGAFNAGLVSFKVALQAMGAASSVEAAKLMQVAAAQAAVATTAVPAAAGITATGLAATAAARAVNGLALAWSVMAATMAIPVIGYIGYLVYKAAKADEDFGKKPMMEQARQARENQKTGRMTPGVREGGGSFGPEGGGAFFAESAVQKYFELWKKENPYLVTALQTDVELMKEFHRQLDALDKNVEVEKIAEQLSLARQELTSAQTARQELLNPQAGQPKATIAERTVADERVKNATDNLQKLRDEMEKTFRATLNTAGTKDLFAQFDKIKGLQASLGKVRATPSAGRKDIADAETALEIEKKKLEVMIAQREERLLTAGLTNEERKRDEIALAHLKSELTAISDSAEAISTARQQMFGGKFEFSDKGVSTAGFGKIFGGYRTTLDEAKKLLEQGKDLPQDMKDTLIRGLEAVGEAAKLPLDLTNLKSLSTELAALEKKIPGITAKLRSAIGVAGIATQRESLSFLDPVEAKNKERLQLAANEEQEVQKNRLNTIKFQGEMANEAQQQLYARGLIGLQTYYSDRRTIVTKNGNEEVRLQQLQIQELEAQQAATRDPEKKRALGIQVTAAREQQRGIEQRTELELEKLHNQEIDTRIKLEKEVAAGQFGLAAQYGGQEEALAQLNYQLEEEAKKYRASNIEGYENFLLKKQEAGILDILAKARERDYKIALGELNLQKEQVNLAEKRRAVRSAEIDAAVSAGMLSEAAGMRLRNEQVLASMEENRQRRSIAQRELDLNQNQKAIEYNQILEKRRGDHISEIEKQKQLQELHQKWATILEGNVEAVLDLDAAFAGLSTSIELYSKRVKESFIDSFADALTQTITNVKNASEIWKSMATQIANEIIGIYMKAFSQKLFQRLSFGFLDRIMGNVGGGSGFGSEAWMHHAEGGPVRGPGTGTSDSIPAMVSAGEHIMPAAKAKAWMPLLEGIRLGKVTAYAAGGLVAVQSIAIPPVIPRRYAAGGVVMADAGAASVNTGPTTGNMVVSLHPDAMNMTLREWLEQEVVRQQGRR